MLDLLGNLQWIIGGLIALIATGAGLMWKSKRSGKKEAQGEHAEDRAKRAAKSRDAIRDGRDSGLSPADRLRRNDGDWRGL